MEQRSETTKRGNMSDFILEKEPRLLPIVKPALAQINILSPARKRRERGLAPHAR